MIQVQGHIILRDHGEYFWQAYKYNPNDTDKSQYGDEKDTSPIMYGDLLRINDLYGPDYATIMKLPSDENHALTAYPGIDKGNESVIALLQGSATDGEKYRRLQCCKGNKKYTDLKLCDTYTPLNQTCDQLLIDYCAVTGLNDPNCGCLLPDPFYDVNKVNGNVIMGPECDSRCEASGSNYLTSVLAARGGCHATICTMDLNDLKATNVKMSLIQNCGNNSNSGGSSPGSATSKNTNYDANGNPTNSDTTVDQDAAAAKKKADDDAAAARKKIIIYISLAIGGLFLTLFVIIMIKRLKRY